MPNSLSAAKNLTTSKFARPAIAAVATILVAGVVQKLTKKSSTPSEDN